MHCSVYSSIVFIVHCWSFRPIIIIILSPLILVIIIITVSRSIDSIHGIHTCNGCKQRYREMNDMNKGAAKIGEWQHWTLTFEWVHVLGMVCKVIGACITLCSDWLADLSVCWLPWELVSDWTVVFVVRASLVMSGTLLVEAPLLLVSLEMTSSSSSPWYALGAESSSSSLNLIHFFLRLWELSWRKGREKVSTW